MILNATTFLIVCPLVFLAGFVDSIAGGGGLISVPAYMIAGLPAHNAIATNKLSSTMGTSVAFGRMARAGQIPWGDVWIYMILAVIGSTCGAHLALVVPERTFKLIMLVIIPLTAFYLLVFKPTTRQQEELPRKQTLLRASVIALGIGIYDGFYGPGTGTFFILLLTAVAHYRTEKAIGINKAFNLSSNVAALTVYLLNGRVVLLLGLVAGLCNMAGNYIGISFFQKKGTRVVPPIMLTVLTIFFLRVVYDLFIAG